MQLILTHPTRNSITKLTLNFRYGLVFSHHIHFWSQTHWHTIYVATFIQNRTTFHKASSSCFDVFNFDIDIGCIEYFILFRGSRLHNLWLPTFRRHHQKSNCGRTLQQCPRTSRVSKSISYPICRKQFLGLNFSFGTKNQLNLSKDT